jgi:hypothetical protein
MYAKVKKTGEILYDAYMDEIDSGYYLVKGIDKEGKKRSFYPHETTDLYSSTKLIVSFNKKEEDTKQVCFLGGAEIENIQEIHHLPICPQPLTLT